MSFVDQLKASFVPAPISTPNVTLQESPPNVTLQESADNVTLQESGLGLTDPFSAIFSAAKATTADISASTAAMQAKSAAAAAAVVSENVKGMQTAMKAYASTAGDTSADPGKVDGKVGDHTILALAHLLSVAPIPKIPATAKKAIPFIILGALQNDSAKREIISEVIKYAKDITLTIEAATLLSHSGGGAGAGSSAGGSIVTSKYPANAYYRFHKTKKLYIVYNPSGFSGLGNLGTNPMTADPDNTGAIAIGTEVDKSAVAGLQDHGDVDDPVYYKWWFWSLIGVGVIGASVGSYFLFFRKPSELSDFDEDWS